MKPEPLSVNTVVATKMVGLGKTKFFELLRKGEIKSFKVGSARLIEVAELRRWIERQKAA